MALSLVIIENGVRWLVENFVLSLGDYSNDGVQFSKWRPDLLIFRSRKLSSLKKFCVLFSRIITTAILLKTISNLRLCEYRNSRYSPIFTSPSVTNC